MSRRGQMVSGRVSSFRHVSPAVVTTVACVAVVEDSGCVDEEVGCVADDELASSATAKFSGACRGPLCVCVGHQEVESSVAGDACVVTTSPKQGRPLVVERDVVFVATWSGDAEHRVGSVTDKVAHGHPLTFGKFIVNALGAVDAHGVGSDGDQIRSRIFR